AAGLGFSVAESLVGFSSALTSLPAHMTPGNWIYDLATLAVFQPLMQGSATGMVVAAIWRYRRGSLAGREIGGVAMAVITHVAFEIGRASCRERVEVRGVAGALKKKKEKSIKEKKE